MQLVVMAAALVLLARVGQGCRLRCRPKNFTMSVESCGLSKDIDTTICEGYCDNNDPVYSDDSQWPEQKVCNGEWSYEMTYIEGCPIGVTYPVASTCECSFCNTKFTDCERFEGDPPSCPLEEAVISS